MKNVTANAAVLLVAGLIVLSAAMPARAETIMRVNIPFTFLAGERMHPAGDYLVRVDPGFRLLDLRPVTSTIAQRVVLDRTSVSRKGLDPMKGFLRFEQLGSTYALRAAGAPAAAAGFGVKPSKAEKELAKANGGASGTEVSLTQ